jgi:hypothetical protein
MKFALSALTTTLALAAAGLTWAGTPPQAPAEIAAAAPAGMTLLSFKASGTQTGATAAAVYETAPDKDGVRHRQLTLFGNTNGKFAPEVTSDKLIACSTCSQYHDDQFYPDHVEVSTGHVHIDQFDSGEMPSTTTFDFVQKQGKWYVTKATRDTYEAGEGDPRREKLAIPASGLVQDMDGRWSVPTYYSALAVNDATGKFAFEHGATTLQQLQKSIAEDCQGPGCRVLVQQQDGCMSLVRDSSGKSFGAGVANHEAKTDAVAKAMSACKAGGGNACKEVRTDCSKGIL